MRYLLAFTLALSLPLGCKKESTSPPVKTQEEETKDVTDGTKIVDDAFYVVAQRCAIGTDNVPKECEGEALTRLRNAIETHGFDALPVLAQALRQGKTKERRHAAFVLNTYISTMVEEAHREGSSLPSKEAAIALIEGSKRVPLTDLVPRDTIGPIVEIATLAGAHEEARDMISRFDPTRREANAIVRAAGVSRLLSYGREPHLAFVVGEAASPHPAVSRAAVDALAGLDAWTDEEKAVLCPLATTLARDEERSRAMDELPSTMLARCDGEHQGQHTIMAEAKRRVDEKIYTPPFSDAVREMCAPMKGEKAAPEVCDLARGLTTRVLTEKGHPIESRQHAVITLGRGWPDAESEALLEKLEAQEDEALLPYTSRALSRLRLNRRIKENDAKTPPPRRARGS